LTNTHLEANEVVLDSQRGQSANIAVRIKPAVPLQRPKSTVDGRFSTLEIDVKLSSQLKNESVLS